MKSDQSAKSITEKWLKYILVILMAIFAGFAVWFVATKIQDTDVMAIPGGYRVVAAEKSGDNMVIYYVYDDKIVLKENKEADDGPAASEVLVYDGVNTSDIVYDGEDALGVCAVSECKSKKKALATIKRRLPVRPVVNT